MTQELVSAYPACAERNDEQLRREVISAILGRERFLRPHIDVNVANGHVVLCGRVGSYYRKQLAQVAAMSVGGVESVENVLVVQ